MSFKISLERHKWQGIEISDSLIHSLHFRRGKKKCFNIDLTYLMIQCNILQLFLRPHKVGFDVNKIRERIFQNTSFLII
jgi:hypothetical protein